jgi:hypothetical protein
MTQAETRLAAGVILVLAVAIPGCRPKAPQQVRLERRWVPGVYLCEARDQIDTDAVKHGDGRGRSHHMRITTAEVAELTVGEADSSGIKRLEWRPRRMAVVLGDAACDSESEAASPSCFAPRAMVKTVYVGHVNPDGTAADDGMAADDDRAAELWSAFRSWMTPQAEWEIMMGDLRRLLAANFGPLNQLPPVVSVGDTWSSTFRASAPAFSGGVVELGLRHQVETIENATGGQLVTIVSTSTGGMSGADVALGAFPGKLKTAHLRSTKVFDVSLGIVTRTSRSASGALDVDFGQGIPGTVKYRYEASTTCRKAGT